ncbi:MAG TPA: hypothetical protein VHH73_02615, partial [Verrucomicrobiae bacterium]|nr:hypothetical protein [Verrucomicrobiae bacterium]
EAIGNRREYVREQLKDGSPVFAASLPGGILLLGVGSGQSKVFELFDRHALAGLGHPADIEKIRQAAIDAAHMEAFTRAPEDVTLRRLVSYGLSPQLKNNFEQLFTAPILVELILAELGDEPGKDTLLRLGFDGAFHPASPIAVASPDPAAERAAQTWLGQVMTGVTDPHAVAELFLQAWWCLITGKDMAGELPPEAERQAGWREAAKGKTVELGWLSRKTRQAARYEQFSPSVLGL